MRWRRAVCVSGALVVLLSLVALAQAVSVATLLADPDRYDGQVVTVSGVVSGYRERVSRAGNAYTTFRLEEGSSSVAVFAWGHRGLRDGQRVRVTGVFQRIRRVGRYTFYNEIEARRVEVLSSRGLLPGGEAVLASAGGDLSDCRLGLAGTDAPGLDVWTQAGAKGSGHVPRVDVCAAPGAGAEEV